MAESRKAEGEESKKGKPRKGGFIKMQVIPDLKADTINEQVSVNVSPGSTLITDDSNSYRDLGGLASIHRPQIIPKDKVGEILAQVHLAISHAKRMILDIHHNIKPKYLQGYLNEFCYKFNRKYFCKAIFLSISYCWRNIKK